MYSHIKGHKSSPKGIIYHHKCKECEVDIIRATKKQSNSLCSDCQEKKRIHEDKCPDCEQKFSNQKVQYRRRCSDCKKAKKATNSTRKRTQPPLPVSPSFPKRKRICAVDSQIVEPSNDTFVYWESQLDRLCGLHALNSLIQVGGFYLNPVFMFSLIWFYIPFTGSNFY